MSQGTPIGLLLALTREAGVVVQAAAAQLGAAARVGGAAPGEVVVSAAAAEAQAAAWEFQVIPGEAAVEVALAALAITPRAPAVGSIPPLTVSLQPASAAVAGRRGSILPGGVSAEGGIASSAASALACTVSVTIPPRVVAVGSAQLFAQGAALDVAPGGVVVPAVLLTLAAAAHGGQVANPAAVVVPWHLFVGMRTL